MFIGIIRVRMGLLLRMVALPVCLIGVLLAAAPAVGAVTLAAVTTTDSGTPLFRSQAGGVSGYKINFYTLGATAPGQGWTRGWFSRYPVCLSEGSHGCFWVLANRKTGSELIRLGLQCYRPEKKFAWHAAFPVFQDWPAASPSAIATGSDGTHWLWLRSPSWKRTQLRIYSKDMRRRLGEYTIVRTGKWLSYFWVLAGNQAVVFLNTIAPGAKACRVVVINEKGVARTTDLTAKVGWHPRYLSSIGNFISGVAPSAGFKAVKTLVNFKITPDGKLTGLQVVAISLPRFPNASPDAYMLLNRHTAICALHMYAHRHVYELAVISLDNGKIKRSVTIPEQSYGLKKADGLIYLISSSGFIHAYTPKLKLVYGFAPLNKNMTSDALSVARPPVH